MQIIRQVTGCHLDVPTGVQVVVNDQSNTNIAHFNIPAKSTNIDIKLIAKELEAVTGGVNPVKKWINKW